MRTLLICLFSGVVSLSTGVGLVQKNTQETLRTRTVSRAEPRMPFKKQRIYECATYRARQRVARLQVKRWLGITPGRPMDRSGFGLSEQYRYDMQQPVWMRAPISRASRRSTARFSTARR
jgi:hypothetical protein